MQHWNGLLDVADDLDNVLSLLAEVLDHFLFEGCTVPFLVLQITHESRELFGPHLMEEVLDTVPIDQLVICQRIGETLDITTPDQAAVFGQHVDDDREQSQREPGCLYPAHDIWSSNASCSGKGISASAKAGFTAKAVERSYL